MFKVPVEKHGVNKEATIIKKLRASNPNICNLWCDFEAAAFSAIKSKSPIACQKGITFQAIDDFLFIKLPSSRKLTYFKPRIIKKDGKEALAYFGNIQASSGWGQISTWGAVNSLKISFKLLLATVLPSLCSD